MNCNIMLETQTNEKTFVCENGEEPVASCVFQKSFQTNHELKKHEDVHRKKQSGIVCHECNTICYTIQNLKKHDRFHAIEKPYVCTVCKSRFYTYQSLELHIPTHTEKKTYVCHICQKSFSDKSNLHAHLKIHMSEKQVPRDEWQKSSSQKGELKYSSEPTGELPYVCYICKESFTTMFHLKTHFDIHMPEKTTECNKCKKSFSHISCLKRHIHIVHAEDEPHVPPVNDKAISSKGHICEDTGQKVYVCQTCQQAFSFESSLKLHICINSL